MINLIISLVCAFVTNSLYHALGNSFVVAFIGGAITMMILVLRGNKWTRDTFN